MPSAIDQAADQKALRDLIERTEAVVAKTPITAATTELTALASTWSGLGRVALAAVEKASVSGTDHTWN